MDTFKENSNLLIMMSGLTGTGKSTIARHLENNINDLIVFHSAEVRNDLNLSPEQIGGTEANYKFSLNDTVFVENVSPKVYAEMLKRAQIELSKSLSVILDGSFSMTWQRQLVYDFVNKHDYPFLVLECVCADEDEVKRRIGLRAGKKNDPLNEAGEWETYLSLKDNSDLLEQDNFAKDLKPPIVTVDTQSGSVELSGLNEGSKNSDIALGLVNLLSELYE